MSPRGHKRGVGVDLCLYGSLADYYFSLFAPPGKGLADASNAGYITGRAHTLQKCIMKLILLNYLIGLQ